MKKLGPLGENVFATLCTEVGIVASKPAEDENGWDSYIEFPLIPKYNISHDKLESAIRCKVQIKATNKPNRRTLAIKLSAMHKLSIEHMPTFVCFIHFNKKAKPQEIYLVHIDNQILENVLRRVRKAEVDKIKTNKITINIPYNEDHKLIEPTGEFLKKSIEKYVPKGMDIYISNKLKIIKEIGYDDYKSLLSFNVKETITREEQITKYLINQEKAHVNVTELNEIRFGIRLRMLDLKKYDIGIMDITYQEKKAQLHFKKNKYDKPIILNILVRINPLVQGAVMIYNDFFTLTIDFEKEQDQKITFFPLVKNDKIYQFKELLNFLKFTNMYFDNDCKDISMNIINPETKQSLSFNIPAYIEAVPINHNNLMNVVLLYERFFNNVSISENIEITYNYLIENVQEVHTFLQIQDINSVDLTSLEISFEENIIIDNLTNIPFFYSVHVNVKGILYLLIVELIADAKEKKNSQIVFSCQNNKVLQQTDIKENEFSFIESLVSDSKAIEYMIIYEDKLKFEFNESRIMNHNELS